MVGGYLTRRPCERPTPPQLRSVSGSGCAAPRAGRGGGVPPAGHAPLPGFPALTGGEAERPRPEPRPPREPRHGAREPLRHRHCLIGGRGPPAQYSQSATPAGASASARSSPEAPPRRYLPLRARMARRPRSRNSKTKSSARSPSLHTLPWLPVYQNPPPRPGGRGRGRWGSARPLPRRSPLRRASRRAPCPVRTSDLVGAIAEAQVEDVVDGAVGIQLVGGAAVADEAVQAPQHEDGPVDELENELLVLTWRGVRGEGPLPVPCLPGLGRVGGAWGQKGP